MSAVALRLRSDLRRHWRAWVGLALLIGIGAGAAMALAQGARRTHDAYPRFARTQRAADVVLTGENGFGLVGAVDLDEVAKLPSVEQEARAFVGLPFTGTLDDGRAIGVSSVFPVAGLDERLGTDVEAWRMRSGRRAASDRVDEAVASFELADRLDLEVGDEIDFHFYAASEFGQTSARLVAAWPQRLRDRHRDDAASSDGADGPRVRVRVVGVEASPAEFPPLNTDLAPVLHLTPAFAKRYRHEIVGSDLAYVRLAPEASLATFQRDVERLAGGEPVSLVATQMSQRQKVQRGIDIEANVLTIVALLVGLAIALVVAQGFARLTRTERVDDPVLLAVGMGSRQLTGIALARASVIAAGGAVVAGVVATMLAPMVLLPLARHADLGDGWQLDGIVLALGTLAIIVVALGTAWWTSRPSRIRTTRAVRARRVRGPGITRPVSAGLGLRLALGRAEVTALGAIVAVAASVAIFVGAFTFTGNLNRQLDEPSRYGWNWDQKIGAPGLPDVSSVLAPALAGDDDVAAAAVGSVTAAQIEDERVDLLGVDQLSGTALPTIAAGRPPEADDEVVLGARTGRHLGVEIGDTVEVGIGPRVREYRVVGQAVFPEFGDAGQLGTGALMTYGGLHRVLPTALRNVYLVRYDPEVSVGTEQLLVARALAPYPTREDARPQDLVDLARGDGLLGFLAVVLALLALAVLAHALFTASRDDRHDYAVLRALGLRRGQVRATVGWQATCIMAGAVVVGVPIGVIGGRIAWEHFATALGMSSEAILPVTLLALAIAGSIMIGAVGALVPAVLAARARPAAVLRAG